jgi:predicted permease
MTILQVIFPIFAMALVGYVAVYKGILDARDTEGISRFVFNITLPALLFSSLARVELPAQFNRKFLFSYSVVALIIYGLGVIASKYGKMMSVLATLFIRLLGWRFLPRTGVALSGSRLTAFPSRF